MTLNLTTLRNAYRNQTEIRGVLREATHQLMRVFAAISTGTVAVVITLYSVLPEDTILSQPPMLLTQLKPAEVVATVEVVAILVALLLSCRYLCLRIGRSKHLATFAVTVGAPLIVGGVNPSQTEPLWLVSAVSWAVLSAMVLVPTVTSAWVLDATERPDTIQRQTDE